MSGEDQFDSVQWDTGATDNVQGPLQDESAQSNDVDQTVQSSRATTSSNKAVKSLKSIHEEKLIVSVSDPQKELEGSKDTFVSYLVVTETDISSFPTSPVNVRRRFQDFYHLHEVLARDFPACVIPPLPDKHRMGECDNNLHHC